MSKENCLPAEVTLRMAYHVSSDVSGLGSFYQRALGLNLRFQDQERWMEMQAGGSRFAIASPEEAAPDCTGPVLVFECGNLQTAEASIIANGGLVLHRRDMGLHGATVTAKDPAGHIFQIFSRKAQA